METEIQILKKGYGFLSGYMKTTLREILMNLLIKLGVNAIFEMSSQRTCQRN